jgi:hypothetical protein
MEKFSSKIDLKISITIMIPIENVFRINQTLRKMLQAGPVRNHSLHSLVSASFLHL